VGAGGESRALPCFFLRQQLPDKLRTYSFKKLLPDSKALPPPRDSYLEKETCKAFHYPGWPAWQAESPIVRAELMAHELEKGMREAYNHEQRMAETERGPQRTPGDAPWDLIRNRFFK
jgi:hypothetical protein